MRAPLRAVLSAGAASRFISYGLANGCDAMPGDWRAAYNRLFAGLKSCSALTQLSAIYSFHAPSQGWSNLNLVDPSKYPTSITGTVTFTPGGGIKGDGSTGLLTNGANESALLSQNDSHMDAVVFAPSGTSQPNTVSTSSAAGRTRLKVGTPSVTDLIVRMTSATDLTVAGAPLLGHFAVDRSSSSTVDVYHDGASLAAAQASTSAAPGANAIQFLRNGPSTYSAATIAWSALGRHHLTAGQEAGYHTAVSQFIASFGGAPGTAQVWYHNNSTSNTVEVAWLHDATTMLKLTLGAVSSNNNLPTITGVQQATIGDPRLAVWSDVVNNSTAGDTFLAPIYLQAVNNGDGASQDFTGGGHAYIGDTTTISAVAGHTDSTVKITTAVAKTWIAGTVINITGSTSGVGLAGGLDGNWAVKAALDSTTYTLQGTTYNGTGTSSSDGTVGAYLPTGGIVSWTVSINGRTLGNEIGFASAIGIAAVGKYNAYNSNTFNSGAGRRVLQDAISIIIVPGCLEFTSLKTALEECYVQRDYGVQMKTSADQSYGYGSYADIIGADPTAILGGTASGSARHYGPGFFGTTIQSGASGTYPTERISIASGNAGFQAILVDTSFGVAVDATYIDPASDTMGQFSASEGKGYLKVIDGGGSNTYQLHLNANDTYTYRAAVAWSPASMATGGLNAAFRHTFGGVRRYVGEFLTAGSGAIVPRAEDIGATVTLSGSAIAAGRDTLGASLSLTGLNYGSAIATET